MRKKAAGFSIIAALILFMFGLARETQGRFFMSFAAGDTATAAKFDVVITAPAEFLLVQDERVMDYRFLSIKDVKLLNFTAQNNGEVDVVCTLAMAGEVNHRIYVMQQERDSFTLKAKEMVAFQIIIGPEGLDATVRSARFFVDIKQAEEDEAV